MKYLALSALLGVPTALIGTLITNDGRYAEVHQTPTGTVYLDNRGGYAEWHEPRRPSHAERRAQRREQPVYYEPVPCYEPILFPEVYPVQNPYTGHWETRVELRRY